MNEELTQRYGLTMTMDDLAAVLKISRGSIYNAISAEQFPIPTYRIGKHRLAKTADVAKLFEEPSHA